MASDHPINFLDWHEAYESPDECIMVLLRQVDPKEAGKMMQADADRDADDGVKVKRRSVLIVDVRRADCESMIPGAINLPAHTLPLSLPTLIPLLAEEELVLFHCSGSRGRRGPRAAGWYADALEEFLRGESKAAADRNDKMEEDRLEAKAVNIGKHVGVLIGGIKAWEKEHGARPIEERGKMQEARTEDGRLDLRTIPA